MSKKPFWQEQGLTAEEYELIKKMIGKEPNELELGMYGVMWSEHCSYKNSRAVLKTFPTKGPHVLQGPGENAGIIDIGDEKAIVMKIESHNHPSAIEPYQGAATGVGGIVRDIFAMGARPIALLNSLRFGDPSDARVRHLFGGVVSGISGYGNCLGIPDVGGEVYFHDCYNGNPLVNAMCVGVIDPAKIAKGIAKGAGNAVMLVGARTGRDGMKGASFASEELSEKSVENRPAVQVGDPFMEKLLLEACLEVIADGEIIGLQDLGAAGLTSASCEMASRGDSGIVIDVLKVPRRETGMKPWEVMLSESQERMLLVVEPAKVARVSEIFAKWDLTAVQIGVVTDDGMLTIKEGDQVVASVPAKTLADDAPIYFRETKEPDYFAECQAFLAGNLAEPGDFGDVLLKLLASPNIASKAWVYEQYDHMVGTDTSVRPGSDAAVMRLKGSKKGIALSTDCNSRYVYLNPRRGGAIAVAEAARNVSCCGAKPLAVTDCLNFGNPEKPEIYWQFKNAVEGMSEACIALGTPVISGNVSFYNEINGVGIYPTPTVGMVGVLDDIDCRVTSCFKQEGDVVVLVGSTKDEIGASEYLKVVHGLDTGNVPQLDLVREKALQELLQQAAAEKLLASAHDCAEGGLAVALAECCIEGGLGARIDLASEVRVPSLLFGETQSRVIVSLNEDGVNRLVDLATQKGLPCTILGRVGGENLTIACYCKELVNLTVDEISKAWREAIPCMME